MAAPLVFGLTNFGRVALSATAIMEKSMAGINPISGNYMFVRRSGLNWLPIYIGQAENLKIRLPNHERLRDAISAGATRVMAHATPGGEWVRLAEEKDLIEQWHPVLNTQHIRETKRG
jgi:hypothetical protein